MTDYTELRRLAEAASTDQWSTMGELLRKDAYWEGWIDYVLAVSPKTILALLDEVEAKPCLCADYAKAEEIQYENAIRERDEAREAVKRLSGALDDIGCGSATLAGYSMSDAIPTIVAALDDPVVRGIVNG